MNSRSGGERWSKWLHYRWSNVGCGKCYLVQNVCTYLKLVLKHTVTSWMYSEVYFCQEKSGLYITGVLTHQLSLFLTVGRWPVCHRDQKKPHIHTYSRFNVSNYLNPNLHDLDDGRKPEYLEKTHTDTGRRCKHFIQKPKSNWDSYQEPFCCEATH